MDYNDWSALGNDIRRMVDDAVNSGDFRRLDENVRRTVADGLENLSESLKKGMGNVTGRKAAPEQGVGRPPQGMVRPSQVRTAGGPGRFRDQTPLFARTFGVQAGAVALLAVGCTVAGGCLIALLIFLIFYLAGMAGNALAVMTGILAVILAGSVAVTWIGKGLLGRTKRFRRYVERLETESTAISMSWPRRLENPRVT